MRSINRRRPSTGKKSPKSGNLITRGVRVGPAQMPKGKRVKKKTANTQKEPFRIPGRPKPPTASKPKGTSKPKRDGKKITGATAGPRPKPPTASKPKGTSKPKRDVKKEAKSFREKVMKKYNFSAKAKGAGDKYRPSRSKKK